MADKKQSDKTRRTGAQVTDTTRSKAPAPKKTAQKKAAPKKKKAPANGRDEQLTVDRPSKWDIFVRQFLPYIFCAVALFLAVAFVLDAISGDVGPNDVGYKMGPVGYYLCNFMFGCFGWVAYILPAVLVVLTVFWRRDMKTWKTVGKIVLSLLLILLVGGVNHAFLCSADDVLAAEYNPLSLYRLGADFESSGIFGGLVGYGLYTLLGLPLTIVFAVITLPLIIMGLINVTPMDVFYRIVDAVRESRRRAAEERAEEEAEEAELRAQREAERADDRKRKGKDDHEDEDNARFRRFSRDEEPDEDEEYEADMPRKGKSRKDDRRQDDRRAKNRREEARYEANDESDLEETEDDTPMLRLNPKTGEVMGPDDAPADRRGKGRAAEAAEELPAEKRPEGLPLFDRRTKPTEEKETPDDRRQDDLPWDKDLTAEALKPTPAVAPEEPEEPEDAMDSMEVSLDDEPGARPAPRARFTTETVAESRPAREHKSAEVTVHILRTEDGAVAERGLSEEELVLPSGNGAFAAEEEEAPEAREYRFPSVDMLTRGSSHYEANEEEIAENTRTLREVLESFRIGVREISCSCGPTITRFEVKPDTGVRVRSIANLVDDISMNLAKAGVRIEAPIPGKNAVGIEVPNAEPSTVHLRNILEAPEFRNHKSRIAACLGADVSGRPVILDINKMPHLLIAGATGMGKSVCINSIIMSILYKAKPDEVKLILIDPKKVEFAMYRDLPHLYAPIVSDPKKAAGALNSAVNEMERRFELIEEVGVRNLAGYNEVTAGDSERPPMPQMVIIIDELADLMMTAPADVETAICRLAQKARAAGIHLIIGTQRPSVDVITGLIKANIPSRIAFTVASSVDSRTIIDTVGADKLIGRGDMLYAPVGATKPMRVQGTFVSETEVERVVTFIKENNDGPVYNEEFTHNIDIEAAKCGSKKKGGDSSDDFDAIGRDDGEDPKFWEALEIVVTKDKIGTSALQRGCKLGYGRAAKIIDRMEELGFIGPDDGTKQGRKVYITKQDFIEYKLNGLPGSGEGGEGEDEA